jgi:hypothetical protein
MEMFSVFFVVRRSSAVGSTGGLNNDSKQLRIAHARNGKSSSSSSNVNHH